jgi:hypothetical protein
VKKLSVLAVAIGLGATLFGFGISYWAVAKYEPRLYHYIFITSGLVSAIYGFYEGFRAIRLGRVTVRRPFIALIVNTLGMAATLYGFSQAFRGLHHLSQGWVSTISFLLVAIGLAGALFGFVRAYKLIAPMLKVRSASTVRA